MKMEISKSGVLFILIVFALVFLFKRSNRRLSNELNEWIVSHGLDGIQEELLKMDVVGFHDLLRVSPKLSLDQNVITKLEKSLVVQRYFSDEGVHISISRKSVNPHQYTIATLNKFEHQYRISSYAYCFLVLVCFWITWKATPPTYDAHTFVYRLFFRRSLAPHLCKITWHWDNKSEVGQTVSFSIEFFQNCGQPYPISNGDGLDVKVSMGSIQVQVASEIGSDFNVMKFSFTVRQAGIYTIQAKLGSTFIAGSPVEREFIAGAPDISKFNIIPNNSKVVVTSDCQNYIYVEPCDVYGNICTINDPESRIKDYNARFKTADVLTTISYDSITKRVRICLPPLAPGYYMLVLEFCGEKIENGEIIIVSLSRTDKEAVSDIVSGDDTKNIEVTMLKKGKDGVFSGKAVTCRMTSRQITFYDSIWLIFFKKIAKFRVSKSTKLNIIECTVRDTSVSKHDKILWIEGAGQPPFYVGGTNVPIIVAAFLEFRLMNMGGSEKFSDKQHYFYYTMRKESIKMRSCTKVNLKINRAGVLESSMNATKSLSINEWRKQFRIKFIDEEGLDEGGVTREWISLLCRALFDPKNQLFRRLHEDSQALVHPNHDRPSNLSLKYFKFAGRIVGKCLFDSAHSMHAAFLIRAAFTRSFLAQILGLPISYEHFKSDDPEYYQCYIRYILDNDTADLDDAYFIDEIILKNGKSKVIELIPSGAKQRVTESNKEQYLNLLAHHRLSTRVLEEIGAFLSGLHDLVPAHLLDIFNENELELLVCGIEEYDVEEMKKHFVRTTSGPQYDRLLGWLWTAVSNFTNEEMAMLLQFITGSSRLPAGGFEKVLPPIRISIQSGGFGKLPVAHTCANDLCLADHETFDKFETSLLYAIREGCEGFGFF